MRSTFTKLFNLHDNAIDIVEHCCDILDFSFENQQAFDKLTQYFVNWLDVFDNWHYRFNNFTKVVRKTEQVSTFHTTER